MRLMWYMRTRRLTLLYPTPRSTGIMGAPNACREKDLTGYDFHSVSKEGFVPVSIKPASEAQLGNIVFR
jgi:hypothetical protein